MKKFDLEYLLKKPFEDLSDEEFCYLLEIQEKQNLDAKDFGPSWLEGIQGSLAQERRKGQKPKSIDYNKLVQKARRYARSLDFSLDSIAQTHNPNDIKLSEFWARYPSTEIYFDINLQGVVKSNFKLLRSFLIYWYFFLEVKNDWIRFIVEEELDKFLRVEGINRNNKAFKECLIIRKIFLVLGRPAGLQLLQSVYRKDNLDRWSQTGRKLSKSCSCIRIPAMNVKEKIRRRGYRESHSNKHKSKDWRKEVIMSNENQELEKAKARIKLKQALLFEKRLDDFLRLEDPSTDQTIRKEIFDKLLGDVSLEELEDEFLSNNIKLPEEEE